MNKTSIEWCRTYAAAGTYEEGFSVNPVRFRPHGSQRLVTMCQKVSPGCKNCYAESIVRRFWPKDGLVRIDSMGQKWPNSEFPGYTALGVSPEVGEFVLDEKTLMSVLKQKKPARVFWEDMSDIGGEWVTDEMLDRMCAVVALTPHLTHMWLTKRPERLRKYFMDDQHRINVLYLVRVHHLRNGYAGPEFRTWPLPNLWLGTSGENTELATRRCWELLQTPAAIRFLSAEPMVDEVDLNRGELICETWRKGATIGTYLDWVICGGESGTRARPMNPAWARSLRDQCAEANVAFFMKQMGSAFGANTGKALPDDLNIRQFPEVRA